MKRMKIAFWTHFLIMLGLIMPAGKMLSQVVPGPQSVASVQKAGGAQLAGTQNTLIFAAKNNPSRLEWGKNAESAKAIVKFRAAPGIKYRNTAPATRGAALSAIESAHVRFQNDLLTMENALRQNNGLRTLGAAQVIKRTYRNVFNGAAVEVSNATLEKVKQLSYVEAVYPDLEVKAVLNESVPLINDETCAVAAVSSGGYWYVGIYAYRAFSGLRLAVSYQ